MLPLALLLALLPPPAAAASRSARPPLQPAAAARLMVQRVLAGTNATGCEWHGSRDPRCQFGRWNYGDSIILDSLLYASAHVPGVNASGFVDTRLDGWLRDGNSSAFNISHGIRPRPVGFGQVPDLYPFVYLSQAEFHRHRARPAPRGYSNATALLVGRAGAQSILEWPKLWSDGMISRDDEHPTDSACWGGGPRQPSGGVKAACVWGDDATMALTPVSRGVAFSASATRRAEARAWLSKQHSLYAVHLQDSGGDGLFFHGQDASLGQHSCCKWSRANGWMMTAHVEVLAALANSSSSGSGGGGGRGWQAGHASTEQEQFDAALAIYRSHAAALAKVQSADGRFYQLLNDSSTWLETSGTCLSQEFKSRVVAPFRCAL